MTRRGEPELRELAAQGARDLEGATATEAISWAARHFPTTLAVTCSMADGTLPSMVAEALPGVDVLFIDTGYHFTDTLVTRDLAAADLNVNVVTVKPVLTVAQQDAAYGERLWQRDPSACCRMRKVEPLRAALRGYEAWVTGVRRDESPSRANTPMISWDEKFGLVKVNPLVDWSFDETLAYASARGLPVNLLLSDGYPSIGCQPCTRRVAEGEDARAGRWAGFAKTECGLHA